MITRYVGGVVSREPYLISSIHFLIFCRLKQKYVIPEHLCKYLEHRDASEDMYEGHAMKNDADVFNSGAAGYILSRETMKKLVEKWDSDDKSCVTNGGPAWLQGNPGLATAKCLKESLNVVATDTRQHGKWHRFHAFPITRLVAGAVDDWYKNKHKVRVIP